MTGATVVASFVLAFGSAKALTNPAAGGLSTRLGRRRLLLLGWVIAIPVPLLLLGAQSWSWVIAANVLLGISQGVTWSTTVVMKIDLVGPQRRGLALGLNETAGYGAVAAARTDRHADRRGRRRLPGSLGHRPARHRRPVRPGRTAPTAVRRVTSSDPPTDLQRSVSTACGDLSYVAGALIAGVVSDLLGTRPAIAVMAALTAAAGCRLHVALRYRPPD